MKCSFGLAFLAACIAPLALAHAQATTPPELLSRRAAEADAYRRLAEVVYGLQVNGYSLVQDFALESEHLRAEVDHFLRGVQLGPPLWHEDGVCEVAAEVTLAQVSGALREIHVRHYRGDDISITDIDSIPARTPREILRVVGVGVARDDLPLSASAPGVGAVPPRAAGPDGGPPIPELWRRLGPQARLMALAAARTDAQRRLAERIAGLRLNATTTVRDFAAERDTVIAELNAELIGAQEVGQYLHDDVLIAEVTLRVPAPQVVEAIKKLRIRRGDEHGLSAIDIERGVSSVATHELEATGMGVPPERQAQRFAEQATLTLPDWATTTLEAEGAGADPELASPQGKLRAARAAELAARRNLIAQIAELTIAQGSSVGALMARLDFVAAEIEALMIDAVPGPTRISDSGATARVTLPGMLVWEVVQDGLRHGGP